MKTEREIKKMSAGFTKYENAMDVICRCISDFRSGIKRYKDKEISDNLSTLNELVENDKKYKWHDLRNDPDDVPKDGNTLVLTAMASWGYRITRAKFMKHDFEVYKDDSDWRPIAWKYIEEFEGVE